MNIMYDRGEDEAVPDTNDYSQFHLAAEALRAGLEDIQGSPADGGAVTMLVVRPAIEARRTADEVTVDVGAGVIGDSWRERGSSRTPDGSANLEDQVTVMNARAALLMAGSTDRMPLAGDQIYADLDLSTDNLPTGTRLEIGTAILEVTALPHTGCAKFTQRFGVDAVRLTATPEGRFLRLRGINTRVVRGGAIRVGDTVRVVRPV